MTLQGHILVRKSFAKRHLEMEAEEQAAIAAAQAFLEDQQERAWKSCYHARQVREKLLGREEDLARLKKAKADKQYLRDQLAKAVEGKPHYHSISPIAT